MTSFVFGVLIVFLLCVFFSHNDDINDLRGDIEDLKRLAESVQDCSGREVELLRYRISMLEKRLEKLGDVCREDYEELVK